MDLVLDYIELAVGNVAEAKAFYSKALGWTFTDYGPDYAGLQDPRHPGQEFGGLNGDGATSGGPGGVMALARTDDAEAAQARIEAAGGRIVLALYEYPGGRRFTFADPWGNVLGVYEPASA
jgi:predicted enzyme related to lactoylglutathione lyase